MGYAGAIEQQVRTIQVYDSQEGLRHLKTIFEEAYADAGVAYDGFLSEARGYVLRALREADAYAVSSDIVAVCSQAGQSLPSSFNFTPDLVPSPAGFLVLDRGVPLVAGDAHVVEGWLWLTVASRVQGESALTRFLVSLPLYRPAHAGPLVFGNISLSSFGDTNSLDADAIAYRAFGALLMFMRQRILATSTHPIPSRQARRRIARELEHDPVVRVIELRARDYQQRDESQSRDIEYTCQWLVRGHWHQYHTKEGIQPRWVMPYVKGPSDKPLRVAEKIAYEVVR